MPYNVCKKDGTLMLLHWVDTFAEADRHLRHYQSAYPPGGQYPNGKGTYPDWGFKIISQTQHRLYYPEWYKYPKCYDCLCPEACRKHGRCYLMQGGPSNGDVSSSV